jgi:hypothetical protein
MLKALRGEASDRKLHLFACACCRQVWHLYTDPRGRQAIETAELFADGGASVDDLARASELAEQAWRDVRPTLQETQASAALRAAVWTASVGTGEWLRMARLNISLCLDPAAQAEVIREIFDNPFDPLPPIDPGWYKWNGGMASMLARVIYHQRRFGDMPVLANALEEAGCTVPAYISHLRGPGPHVRGCHVLDALLGKE